ncbi:MAG: hypothetical protein ABEJ36_04510 [Candidatus Nanosalina sp.]
MGHISFSGGDPRITVVEEEFDFDPETDDLTHIFRNRRAVDVLESVEQGVSSASEIADKTGYSASSVRNYLSEQEEAKLLDFEAEDDGLKKYDTTDFGSELFDRFRDYESCLGDFKTEVEGILQEVSEKVDIEDEEDIDYSEIRSSLATVLVDNREYDWEIETYLNDLEWVAESEDERDVALTVLEKMREGRADIARYLQGSWAGMKQVEENLDTDYGVRTAARRMRDRGLIGEMKPEGSIVRVTDKGSELLEKDGLNLESDSTGLEVLNTPKRRKLLRQVVRKSTVEEISDSLGWSSEEVRNNLKYLEQEDIVETQLSNQLVFKNNSRLIEPTLDLLDWYEKESACKRDIRNYMDEISTLFGEIWRKESYKSIIDMVKSLKSGSSFDEVEESLPEWRNTVVNRLEYFTEAGLFDYEGGGEFESNEGLDEIMDVTDDFVQESNLSDPVDLLRWAGSSKKLRLVLDAEGEDSYSDVAEKIDEESEWVEKYAKVFKDRDMIERRGLGTDFDSIGYTEQGINYLSFLKDVAEVFREEELEVQEDSSLNELRKIETVPSREKKSETSVNHEESSDNGPFSGFDTSEVTGIMKDIDGAEDGLDFTLLDVRYENPREIVERLEDLGWVEQENGREKMTEEGEEFFKAW